MTKNWTIKSNGFSIINLNFPWLRNAENLAFWGIFCSIIRIMFPVFKQHEILDQKMQFHDFSMASAIFRKIHDFSHNDRKPCTYHYFTISQQPFMCTSKWKHLQTGVQRSTCQSLSSPPRQPLSRMLRLGRKSREQTQSLWAPVTCWQRENWC